MYKGDWIHQENKYQSIVQSVLQIKYKAIIQLSMNWVQIHKIWKDNYTLMLVQPLWSLEPTKLGKHESKWKSISYYETLLNF